MDNTLMKYGDTYHRSVGGTLHTDPTITWRKTGCVRSVLTIEGVMIPLLEYDHGTHSMPSYEMIEVKERLQVGVGYGTHTISFKDALGIIQAEVALFKKTLEESAYYAQAIPGKMDVACRDWQEYAPSRWYQYSPVHWLAAAREGVAVLYGPRGTFRWCTPEEATAAADDPISEEEYLREMGVALEACLDHI